MTAVPKLESCVVYGGVFMGGVRGQNPPTTRFFIINIYKENMYT